MGREGTAPGAKEETGSLIGDPEPPAQAWTELQETTFSTSDGYANSFQNAVSIFRLNDISPNSDWYMVLTDPASTPHYKGCNGFDCGWWTNQRVLRCPPIHKPCCSITVPSTRSRRRMPVLVSGV